MDPVDQGTLAMLLFGGAMALVATLYFTVRWYYKRKSKFSPTTQKYKKQRLRQTFSRFSAVDEELTVHEPTASDRDLIISYCEPEGQGTPTMAPRTQSFGRGTPTLGARTVSLSPQTSSVEPRIQTVSLEVETKTSRTEMETAQSSTALQTSRPSYLETDL